MKRETPFGSPKRTTKRSLYRISDPFLRSWFRFVEPNLSRLEARSVDSVLRDVESSFSHHVAGIWEDLARASVPGSGTLAVSNQAKPLIALIPLAPLRVAAPVEV